MRYTHQISGFASTTGGKGHAVTGVSQLFSDHSPDHGRICCTTLDHNIPRVSYAVAVNDIDPATRQIPIGVMAVSNLVDAGLQTAEATIH
ncbi:hypothetical protein N7448_011096 [Penicillium atrosanguineum]|uniref:Uncharacterized protein n=1 Tax=Penicillium atrosanguineum TaxID=1132637 RepID=A0A9W9GE88_9EURO|nr:uncharacterized protein N7443_009490 [Penicillium atrosanguineum]KAJ5117464.1 hypothetical protein N7448_011096 [Penicillium atrosanguineum]KAJ5144427.1 hypothetical protein N7526_001935 [Penicillium atrosanguineum]KAJ5293537.1 hypothetical protein N7443_009490 [Penicillium atrosanguineum]KAJ5318251.1 hypothetical protein N7476_004671 [Penicillium atrosanguineum]